MAFNFSTYTCFLIFTVSLLLVEELTYKCFFLQRRQIWGKRHGDDTHSDLSEDVTSDSGRGGSVENVHHHQMYPRSGIVI